MPYKLGHSTKGWFVENILTRVRHGYMSSKEKAEAQMRLLQAIDHGYKPR